MTLPRPRASSAWLITVAATAASTYALDAVATAAGVLLVASGAAERARPPARARLPCRHVRALGRRPAREPARELAAAAPDRDQHQRAVEGRLRAHAAARRAHAAVRGGRGLRRDRAGQGGALLRGRVRRRGTDRHRLVRRRAALPRGRQPRRRRLRVRPRSPDAQAAAPAALRVVRHRLGAAGLPGRLLQRRRARRARDDRLLRRRDQAGAGRRAGAGPRHRADAAPRLPRRAQGRRRSTSPTTCRRTSRRSSAGATATPPRTTGAPSSATRSNARVSPRRPTRRSRGARSSPAQGSRGCCRSTRAGRFRSTATRR